MSELPKIVRERLAQAAAGPHPDPDQLTAFAEHSLAARERAQVLTHLSACADCREVVALAAPPQTAADLAPVAEPARGWFAWSYMRWSGVVAAVLLIAAVALVFEQQWKSDLALVGSERTPQPREVARQSELDTSAKNERSAAAAEPPAASDEREVRPATPAQASARQRESSDQLRKDQPATREAVSGGALGRTVPATEVAEEAGGKRTASAATRVAGATMGGPVMRDEARPATAELKKEQDARANNFELATPSAGKPDEAELRAQTAPPPPPGPGKAKASEVTAQSKLSTAEPAAVPDQGYTYSAGRAAGFSASPFQWRISSSGTLERSADGRAWTTALSASETKLTTFAVLGNHVWAGGSGGVVYLSNDSGRRWVRRQLSYQGADEIGEITGISLVESADHPVAGTVYLKGRAYFSQDGGATWGIAEFSTPRQ